jgi:ribonuclease G
MPAWVEKLRLYQKKEPLFSQYDIEIELAKALHRRVDLPNGAYMIFDQTEALTTIDINTGRFVGVSEFEQTIYQTNLKVIPELARQIRLRHLGGMIIIDFIDMQNEQHRQSVLMELCKAMAQDRMHSSIGGFTSLGLVELTRKRTHESLQRMLCRPCVVCSGSGQLKSVQTVCYELLREAAYRLGQNSMGNWRVVAHPDVIEQLRTQEKKSWDEVCAMASSPPELLAQGDYRLDQFEWVHSSGENGVVV